MTNINIIEIRRLEDLEKHQEEWDTLIQKCPGSVHTQSFAVIYSFFLNSLQPNRRWICLLAYDRSKLIAVYPLIVGRRIGIPGLCLQTFATPYDTFQAIRIDSLILPGYESTLEVFIDHLRKSFRAFPIITLRGIPELSPSIVYFHYKQKSLSFYKKYAGEETFIPLSDNYQKYLSGLKPKFRSDIERRLRKLSAWDHNVYFRFRDNQRTNEENLEIFKEIESGGWKGRKKTDIKTRSKDSEFFHTATNKLHEKGWIQWNFMEVNNETIAAQLHVRINNTTVFWKIAYKEKYGLYAPGILLLYKSIEDCYNHGEFVEINLMNKKEWFGNWNVKNRPLYNLKIMPNRFLFTQLIILYLRIKNMCSVIN